MSDEILIGIGEDLKDAEVSATTATELISAMKEAGEDVTEMEAKLRALKMRMDKWKKMLEVRGIGT